MLDKTKTKTVVERSPPVERIVITPPNFRRATILICGTAPYVQNKMSARAKRKMREGQLLGGKAKGNRKKEPKNFEEVYEGTWHKSREGWYGIPAGGFRTGLIDASRVAGYAMTKAKMTIFVVPNGYDAETGEALIHLLAGEPRRVEHVVKLADGSPDILPRPMWDEWKAKVTLEWDADQFLAEDVVNLLMRMGCQVGIGAGRPFSKYSAGMGWGTFEVKT